MKIRFVVVASFSWLLATVLPLRSVAASAKPSDRQEGQSAPAAPKSDITRDREALKASYVLLPRDVIRVQVFQEDDITKQGEVTVSQEFNINLPLIGSVDLRGKTVRQVEQLIHDLYDRDYLVDPQITVTVVKYADRFVKIFGQVSKPGDVVFPPEDGLTFSDAISRAGGFTRLADLKRVTITRTMPDGDTKLMTINAGELIKGGSTDDVVLQPNDIINVAERIL